MCILYDLDVEKGRQTGIVRKERMCRLCGRDNEDEKHFAVLSGIYRPKSQIHSR